MTDSPTASQQITKTVTSWTGVESGHGRRGEFAFKVEGKEIGHLHGDHAAHFFFPREVFDELFAVERISHHPVFPDRRGPAARRIESQADVDDVIELMRLNYDRSGARSRGRRPPEPLGGADLAEGNPLLAVESARCAG